MPAAALPPDEAARMTALLQCRILDTPPERSFDDLTQLAARLCETPISLVSLVDDDRQWFKSACGLEAPQTPRESAFCAHAILGDTPLIVPDATRDPRTVDNGLVTGPPHIRFYAGVPLRTADGHALGTLCVIDTTPRELTTRQLEDLTALAHQASSQLELRRKAGRLTQINAELSQLNRELDEFTHIASHDLQEPLRKLMSFSALLRQDIDGDLPPRATQDLDFIVDAAGRMQKLVNDLLALSRSGRSALQVNPLELGDCVQDALAALSERVRSSGARIHVEPLPTVFGDRTLLTQLYQNLVGNALKYAHPDRPAEIRITAEQRSGAWIFGVRDNGIGIPAEYTDQVFAPFKRLHGRSEYDGTGIGLAICRKAIERHEGRIWVESEPGTGSHFRFTLGLHRDHSECLRNSLQSQPSCP